MKQNKGLDLYIYKNYLRETKSGTDKRICFKHLDDFELCRCENFSNKQGGVKERIKFFENYPWW